MVDHKVDRSNWAPGPWDSEPEDRVEWRHRGFPCLAVRNSLGAWCGYVAVPPGHPWHGKGYDAIDADCHGGLTFSDGCHPDSAICHVPAPGEPEDVWWLGFDCAHAGDHIPKLESLVTRAQIARLVGDTYCPLGYVRAGVERLADQAAHAVKDEEGKSKE